MHTLRVPFQHCSRAWAMAVCLSLCFWGAGAPRVLAQEYQSFLGTLHDHSGAGGDDGHGTLAEAFQSAREAKYDFFALSPHGHMISPSDYAELVEASASESQEGSFVVFPAFEWGTISKGGHVGVVGTSRLCQAHGGHWEDFWSWRQEQAPEALVILNHPVWNREFGGAPTLERVRTTALVEVIGGPSEWKGDPFGARGDFFHEDLLHSLNQGWRSGVVAGEDDHTGNWGRVSRLRTGVWATQLRRKELFEAFQQRRTFATEDPELQVWIEVDGQPMGSVLPWKGTGSSYRLSYRVQHASEAVSEVSILADLDGVGGATATERARGGAEGSLELGPTAPGSYVFVVARDASGDLVWSSAVWMGESDRTLSVEEELGGGEALAPDPNFDDSARLQSIPGLGKGTARKITQARKEGTFFLGIEDLRRIPGVDPGTWDRILPHLLIRSPEQHLDLLQRLIPSLGSLVATEADRAAILEDVGRLEEILATQLENLLLFGEASRVHQLRVRFLDMGEEYAEVRRGVERRLRSRLLAKGQEDLLEELR